MPISQNLPVNIISVENDVEQTRLINFAHKSDRIWLEKHMFWAAYNGVKIGFDPVNEPATNYSDISTCA